jgi:uncharacterized protein YbaR (Trm112 family)
MVNPEAALREVRRVLGADALFVLEYANKRNLKAILRFLLMRQSWNPFSLEPVEYVKLNFDFHPQAVQKWLKRIIPPRALAFFDSIFGLSGNIIQLTPSVFILAQTVSARTKKSTGFFRCPACSGSDFSEESIPEIRYLACQSCHLRYPIKDGIYNFKEPLPF